ncbi:MAG TPA: hypothetical protein VHI14_09325 [Jatrophihabitantaceae bacterium]|nr:hypothetical protein [Jatrophihabitantaceae bacterium]
MHKRGAPPGRHAYLDVRVDTGHGFHFVTVDCAGSTCQYRSSPTGWRAVVFEQSDTSWVYRSVILVRPDGAAIAVQATNQISVATKTHSDQFGGQPSLTVPQMIAIVTSDRW